MNLDKIKQEADEKDVYENEIKQLKESAKQEFQVLFSVEGKSYPLWKEKMKKSVDTFVTDFVRYMKKNEFVIECEDFKVTEDNYTEINAHYKSEKISLSCVNYDGEKMCFMVNGDCKAEFWFDFPDNVPKYLYWKDNISVNGKQLSDFGTIVNLAYNDFVDSFNAKDELQEVIKKVQINIEHFKNSIENIDKYNFCIRKWGEEKVYKGFQEFVDSIDD